MTRNGSLWGHPQGLRGKGGPGGCSNNPMLDRLFPSDSAKMLVAMKPNAPNQLNQFDRATVNRPLMRARLGACRGGELQPHHFHDHGARPIVPCRVIRRMTLILKHGNKNRSRRATDWGPNDFDVLDAGRCIGRIFLSPQSPSDRNWMWTITPRASDGGF